MTDTVRNPTMDNLRSLLGQINISPNAPPQIMVAYDPTGIAVTIKGLFQDHHYRVDNDGVYEVREGYSFIKQYLP